MNTKAFLVGVATLADPFGFSMPMIRAVSAEATRVDASAPSMDRTYADAMARLRAAHRAMAAGQITALVSVLAMGTSGALLIIGAHQDVIGGAMALTPLVMINGLWHYFRRQVQKENQNGLC